MDKLSILGVKVNSENFDEVIESIIKTIKNKEKNVIYTPNTEIIMMCQKDSELKSILNSGDIVTPDGIGLVYASKMYRKKIQERVAGYDISMELLNISKSQNLNVFFLGGKKGIAKKAKEILEKKGFANIVGYHHGYFFNEDNYKEIEYEIIKKINSLNTNILFVGFGSPKQEKWINDNIEKLNCNIIIGNGGTIDVLAGKAKRAPDIFQRLGLEWFYRLIQEPKRIKRQLSIPKFMLKIIFTKNSVKNL